MKENMKAIWKKRANNTRSGQVDGTRRVFISVFVALGFSHLNGASPPDPARVTRAAQRYSGN